MKKQTDSDFLPEYDFAAGVRGKYVSRLATGTNIVVLDKDVQQILPDSVAVNTALRALGKAVEIVQSCGGTAKRPARARVKSATAG